MSTATDVLNIDIELAIPRLYRVAKETGEAQEIDFPGGLTLRVTPLQAIIFADDPDEETLEALEASGRSFCVV